MRGIIVRMAATGAGALLALGLLAAPPAGAAGSGGHGKGERGSKAEQSGKVTCFKDDGHTQGRSLSDPDGGSPDKPGCGPDAAAADVDGNNGCGNDDDRDDDNNGNCGGPAKGPKDEKPAKVKAAKADEDKVDVEKVDGDIEVRCPRHHDDGDHDDDESTPSTDVSGAGTGTDCSCPKDKDNDDSESDDDDSAVLGASDSKEQAAGELAAEASATTAGTPETSVLGASLTAPAPAGTAASATTPQTQVLGETLSAPDTLARTGAGVGALALIGGLLVGGGRLTALTRRFLRIG